MSKESQTSAASSHVQPGAKCLLSVLDRHFMVEILGVEHDTLRVSFPGVDYPVDGMKVDLEFHDNTGFFCYHSNVLQGPQKRGDGIVLTMPEKCTRNEHRESCRVSTDLIVQVRDQVHLRKYNAHLRNLSAGGARIESEAAFELDTTIEMYLSLPGEPVATILGRVIHVGELANVCGHSMWLYGVRFLGLEADQQNAIVHYIWKRLRELYTVP